MFFQSGRQFLCEWYIFSAITPQSKKKEEEQENAVFCDNFFEGQFCNKALSKLLAIESDKIPIFGTIYGNFGSLMVP